MLEKLLVLEAARSSATVDHAASSRSAQSPQYHKDRVEDLADIPRISAYRVRVRLRLIHFAQ